MIKRLYFKTNDHQQLNNLKVLFKGNWSNIAILKF